MPIGTSYFNDKCQQYRQAGLDPVPIKPGTKAPMLTGWQHETFEPGRKFRRWGIGHRTHTLGAMDIDVKNPELAQWTLRWALERFEESNYRIGAPPKSLILGWNGYGEKRVSATYKDSEGRESRIEFLGDGQQCVCEGIHPGTKREYTWSDGSPLQLDYPSFEASDVEAAFDAFEAKAEDLGLERVSDRPSGRRRGHRKVPRPEVLPEMPAALTAIGEPNENGVVPVRCPFKDHQNQTGAYYFTPGEGNNWAGGFKCHHPDCEGKGIREVRELDPPDPALFTSHLDRCQYLEREWKGLLPVKTLTAGGNIAMKQVPSVPNVQAVLDKVGVSLRFDMLRKQVDGIDPVEFQDLLQHAHLGRRSDYLGERYHPLEDWLRVEWDGAHRLDLLAATVPTTDPELFAEALGRWLAQGVRGVLDPGRPLENVLVLVGPGDYYKSSWFGSLFPAGSFLGEQPMVNTMSHHGDEMQRVLGHWCVELAELDGSFRRSDSASTKSFLSRTEDTWRVAYGSQSQTYPRQTFFCATTNEWNYLRDQTGNRRFWTFQVTAPIRSRHEMDMRQVFAEARETYQGDIPGSFSQAIAAANEKHVHQTTTIAALEDKFEEWTVGPTQAYGVNTTDLVEALGLSKSFATSGEIGTWMTGSFGPRSGRGNWVSGVKNRKKNAWRVSVNQIGASELCLGGGHGGPKNSKKPL